MNALHAAILRKPFVSLINYSFKFLQQRKLQVPNSIHCVRIKLCLEFFVFQMT